MPYFRAFVFCEPKSLPKASSKTKPRLRGYADLWGAEVSGNTDKKALKLILKPNDDE
jgi:hypothetical protein